MVYILILLTAVSFALSIITMTRTVKLKRLLGEFRKTSSEYRETTSEHELRIKKLENRYFKPEPPRNSDNVYINKDGIPVVRKKETPFLIRSHIFLFFKFI